MAKQNPKKLTKQFVGKPLPQVEAVSADATAVQVDPRKKKQIGNYKRVDSQFADAFRDIVPAPDNVAQMLAKRVFGDARMSNASLDDEQKVMLWDVMQNAKKRTGKSDGGTEYQDYGGLGYGDSEQFNDWFNRGNFTDLQAAYQSFVNPAFKLGSTIGRGRYWSDPENPDKMYYTDVYDWNAHEKNFAGTTNYQKLRNEVRAGEDKNLNAQKNENYRMNFELDAKEIEKLRKKVNDEKAVPFLMKDGGWLDKYNDGGPVQPNYNDYSVSAGPGFQGDGYSNVGRNYSPAWGGQFQDGGNLSFIDNPKLRNMLEGYKPGLMNTVNDYRLPEGRMAGSIYPSSEVSRSVGGEDGEPAYLIPSFKYGAPLQDYVQEFNMTGQHLGGPFKTWQDAERFGELRHDYVEKGQPLPSPIATSNMAMGGSLPGATGFMYSRQGSGSSQPGDVDFSYPRTKGIPKKGPNAKDNIKTPASAQNGAEMKFYQNGLDWKPKSISKDGSVIKDDMGQWNHPGEITEIDSNQITMQGVPYPVLGISDTGDTQMMYPDQDYQFIGDSVTEYPMMKEGGALQLVKLDQLTNFTNYNTKQPGQNWLDKYQ